MLKPRKSKTALVIVTRYADSQQGFPEGFGVYLGKHRLDYIDGVKVGARIKAAVDSKLPIFNLSKTDRIIYRKLQGGYVQATIGVGPKYYGLRKLKPLPKKKNTYMEELQEELFGRPDYRNSGHIGINAHRDKGHKSTMDRLFKDPYVYGKPEEVAQPTDGSFLAGLNRESILTSDCRVSKKVVNEQDLSISECMRLMTEGNVNFALRDLNFTSVKVKYTSDAIADIESELEMGYDDINYIQHLHQLRQILPDYGTFTMVDTMLSLPLLSETTEAIIAAAKRKMLTMPKAFAEQLKEPTPAGLVDWLNHYSVLNQPKTVDYLSSLSQTPLTEEDRAMLNRIRSLANNCDVKFLLPIHNGGEVSSRPYSLIASTPSKEDTPPNGLASYGHYLKHRKDHPGAQLFTFDSLSQHPDLLDKDDNE